MLSISELLPNSRLVAGIERSRLRSLACGSWSGMTSGETEKSTASGRKAGESVERRPVEADEGARRLSTPATLDETGVTDERLDTATTCLTRFSSNATRSRKAAFSARSEVTRSRSTTVLSTSVESNGFTSSAISTPAGGGATAARLTPPLVAIDISEPETVMLGDDDRLAVTDGGAADVDRVGEPDLSDLFSASNSATRDSRYARWALR